VGCGSGGLFFVLIFLLDFINFSIKNDVTFNKVIPLYGCAHAWRLLENEKKFKKV